MNATLCYLNKTRNYGLHFIPEQKSAHIRAIGMKRAFMACAESDCANDKQDIISETGRFFTCQDKPITWLSKKKNVVATSTAKSEYRSIT